MHYVFIYRMKKWELTSCEGDSRPVGLMNVTGQPKGNRNFVSRSGVTPVTISSGEVEFPISLLGLGLQLAVWIQDSTA